MYFLTEVSEKDLMNFTLSDSVTLPEVDTVYAEPEKKVEEEKPETTETAEKDKVEDEGRKNPDAGNDRDCTVEKDKVEDEIQMPEDKSTVWNVSFDCTGCSRSCGRRILLQSL